MEKDFDKKRDKCGDVDEDEEGSGDVEGRSTQDEE